VFIKGSRRVGAAAAGVVVLSMQGCASVTTGNTQNVSVETVSVAQGISGANCELTNDKGRWSLISPATVSVRLSYQDLAARCESEAFEPGVATFKSTTKPIAFGNILIGGLIGATIDVTSGAAYQYPTMLTVTMGRPTGKTPAVPAAPTDAAWLPQAGDAWEYSVVDQYTRIARAVTWTINSVADGVVTFDAGNRVEVPLRRSVKTIAPNAGDLDAFEPPQGWARPGLAAGQSWAVSYEANDGLPRSQVDLTAQVLRRETVKTAAGVFQARVVEYRGSANRNSGTATLPHRAVFTVWIDEASARVVRFESDIHASGGSQAARSSRERVELVRVGRWADMRPAR